MAVVDTARFTSSLAAATLEDGMTLDSGPWGLGNVYVRWRYLIKQSHLLLLNEFE